MVLCLISVSVGGAFLGLRARETPNTFIPCKITKITECPQIIKVQQV